MIIQIIRQPENVQSYGGPKLHCEKPNFMIIKQQVHKVKKRNGSCGLILVSKGKAAACKHKEGNYWEQVALKKVLLEQLNNCF